MDKTKKERRKKIVETMLAAGAANREIATAIGINDPSGVSHYIKSHINFAKRRRKSQWSDAEMELLRLLWESEKPMCEIESTFAYKRCKNIRQVMSRLMYMMRIKGLSKAKRTVNGVRK